METIKTVQSTTETDITTFIDGILSEDIMNAHSREIRLQQRFTGISQEEYLRAIKHMKSVRSHISLGDEYAKRLKKHRCRQLNTFLIGVAVKFT